MNLVDAKRQYLFLYTLKAGPGNDRLQPTANCLASLQTFSQKLKTYIGNVRAFCLTIYKYVVHNLIRWCG